MEELYKVMDDLLVLEFFIIVGLDFMKDLDDVFASD